MEHQAFPEDLLLALRLHDRVGHAIRLARAEAPDVRQAVARARAEAACERQESLQTIAEHT